MADQTSPSDGIGFLLNNVAGVGGGPGTFPANAAFTPGGSKPNSVTVGNFILNPVPPPAPATTADAAVADDNSVGGVTIIPSDGLGNFTGAQTTVPTAPFTVAVASGVFNNAGLSIVAVNGGNAAGTSPSIDILLHDNVGVPVNVPIPATVGSHLDDPRAIVVGDFNGDGLTDFAILSGPQTGGDDYVTVFVNTTNPGGSPTFAVETPTGDSVDVNPGAVAMAAGFFSGNVIFNDLAIVYNTASTNDLRVLQNTSSSSVTSFNSHLITGSVFPGTAVGVAAGTLYSSPTNGFQDIAVVYQATGTPAGQIPATGYTIPANESLVRVFQDTGIGYGFPVTPDPVTAGDYDAGANFTATLTSGSSTVPVNTTQGLFVGEIVTGTGIPNTPNFTTIQSISTATNTIILSANATATGSQTLIASETDPTAITVAGLGSAGGSWNSIVVTNHDFAAVQSGALVQVPLGTVSVLNPIARPTPPTTPFTSKFVVNVSVPTPAAITDLTAFMEVTDTALADLKIVLTAPGPGGVAGTGPSITLVENQNIYVGTSTVLVSNNVGITGSSMGIFDYSPGPPTIPGFPVGTVFDDTATNDIVNINPVGLYGAGPPTASPRGAQTDYIGHWRPESEDMTPSGTGGMTLAQFIANVQALGSINGQWTLEITDQIPKDFGQVQAFSLQFSSTQTTTSINPIASQFSYVYPGNTVAFPTVAVLGALGNVYTAQGSIPAAPNTGVGPGLVIAMTTRWGPIARIKAGSTPRSWGTSITALRRRERKTRRPTPTSSWSRGPLTRSPSE